MGLGHDKQGLHVHISAEPEAFLVSPWNWYVSSLFADMASCVILQILAVSGTFVCGRSVVPIKALSSVLLPAKQRGDHYSSTCKRPASMGSCCAGGSMCC